MNYSEVRPILKKFTDITKFTYGDYGYALGYYESVMSHMLAKLPKELRERYINQLINHTEKLEYDRTLENQRKNNVTPS
jgi:hypothetical protein